MFSYDIYIFRITNIVFYLLKFILYFLFPPSSWYVVSKIILLKRYADLKKTTLFFILITFWLFGCAFTILDTLSIVLYYNGTSSQNDVFQHQKNNKLRYSKGYSIFLSQKIQVIAYFMQISFNFQGDSMYIQRIKIKGKKKKLVALDDLPSSSGKAVGAIFCKLHAWKRHQQ